MLGFLYSKTPLSWLIQSLWRDEAFSVILAKKSLLDLLFSSAKDYTPPVYYLILKVWMAFFGSSEIAVRSLSIVFFIFSVYLFFEILEMLKIQKKLLYLTTIVFATLPSVVYFAFEARPYALLVFLTLLSYFAILYKNPRFYLITNTIALYTNYFFIFILFAQFLYFYFFDKKAKALFLRQLILSLIFFFPWVIFLFWIKSYVFFGDFWVKNLTVGKIFDGFILVVTSYLENWDKVFPYWRFFSLFFNLVLVFVAYQVLVEYKNHSRRREAKDLVLFFLGFFIPYVCVLFISLFKPVFEGRYLVFILPCFFVSLSLVLNRISFKALGLGVVFLILFFNLSYLKFMVKYRKKYDWSAKLSLMKSYLEQKQHIYLLNPEEYFIFLYYLPEMEDKVYILGKTYESLPSYVGKVLYPKDKFVLNFHLSKELKIVFKDNGKFFLQALN